jgi:transcriptional regulator with XRE-family HTH domain
MKIEITKEWCLRMAHLEGDAEIGAGLLSFDPIPNLDLSPVIDSLDEPGIVFGRFVQLMRRNHGLTIEKLAEDSDVEIAELVEIEDDAHHKPQGRTVYQLANYFKVPHSNLLQVAGLTAPRDSRILEEGVRFAARLEPVSELSPEERAALEAFVAVIGSD